MRVLRNLLWFVVSAVSAAACTHASAQTAGFNDFGSWSYEWANGKVTGTLTGPNGQTTHYPMGPSAVGQTTPNGAGGVTRSISGPVTLAGASGSNAATATITASRTATARQIAQGALPLLKRGPVGALGSLAVGAGLTWALDRWMKPDMSSAVPVVPSGTPGWSEYDLCARMEPGQTIVMDGGSNHAFYRMAYPNDIQAGYSPIGNCTAKPYTPNGFPQIHRKLINTPYNPEYEPIPASDGDLEDAVTGALEDNPASAPSVHDQVASYGGEILASSPVVTGPASVNSPSKTTTTSTGSKTSQTTYNITYNNSSYSYSSSTTTTTKDSEGNTTDETTEDTSPEPGDVEVTPAVRDTSMPPVPTLYERKYPDGIIGVWETRKAELQETGFSAALDALLPDIPDGGGCPQFSLPGGTIAGFAFPGGNLGPPCWVWPWVKVVIVITSLFLARSLVFGG